jgi:hypothetical protein
MTRRIAIAALAVCSVLPSCGSRRQQPPLLQEEQPFPGLSELQVADPKAQPQFLLGWHNIEEAAWRWTRKRFAAALQVPSRPATVELNYYVPEASLTTLGAITLTATVNRLRLPAQTCQAAGEQVYSQTVPASALKRDVAVVWFEVDKAISPGGRESRELGVVVSSVRLRK